LFLFGFVIGPQCHDFESPIPVFTAQRQFLLETTLSTIVARLDDFLPRIPRLDTNPNGRARSPIPNDGQPSIFDPFNTQEIALEGG